MRHFFRNKIMTYSKALTIGPFVILALTASADRTNAPAATIRNFSSVDLLDGDDGLPPNPKAAFRYGAPTLHVDTEGNVIEEHNATLSFFEGRYYLYTQRLGCGRLSFLGVAVPGLGKPVPHTRIDSGVKCEFAIYSSADLMRWKPEGVYSPTGLDEASKPQVHFSKSLKKYVFWFSSGANLVASGGFRYAVGDSPAGPWSEPKVATGDHLAHDFDIAWGREGEAYILSDSFSGKFDSRGAPLWDVWVQRLKPDLSGTVGTPDSSVKVMTAADFEAVGFFQHNGRWYITGGPTCSNCQVPITYVSAPSALGPWRNERGDTGDALHEGTMLAPFGCNGQNKGANVLPSANGPVVVEGVWGYRTGPKSWAPGPMVNHGDNNQSISSTYWFPLEFTADKRIKPFTCPANVRIPLVPQRSPKLLPPPPYQPDCRIRRDMTIEQRFDTPTRRASSIRIPVFQRTDDLGPYDQDGAVINAPLHVDVHLSNGKTASFDFEPKTIAWSPRSIDLPLGATASSIRSIGFSTAATNGCFGVVVKPRVAGGKYTATKGSVETVAPKAQLFFTD